MFQNKKKHKEWQYSHSPDWFSQKLKVENWKKCYIIPCFGHSGAPENTRFPPLGYCRNVEEQCVNFQTQNWQKGWFYQVSSKQLWKMGLDSKTHRKSRSNKHFLTPIYCAQLLLSNIYVLLRNLLPNKK